MTLDEAKQILFQCAYPGVRFEVTTEWNRAFLRVAQDQEEDSVMYGRKWRLSDHMTKSEIVQTAFLAIKTWEEHETREKFTYKGKAIFGPHLDVEVLHQTADYLDARRAGP